MNNYKKTLMFFLMVMAIAVVTAVATIRNKDQSSPSSEEQQQSDLENQFPTADYSNPLPTSSEERVKRQSRNKKYDKSLMVGEKDEITVSTRDWASHLSAIPVVESNVIVVGEVTDAKAFLSNDKTGVYSEFSFRISDVLKNAQQTPLASGNTITLERPGGRVKFPSGHISTYFIVGQGMPRVGRQYVLFLTKDEQNADFLILTGYELRAGCVVLLDNPGEGHPIYANKGKDVTSLLNDIKFAISSAVTPK
jgi:hypothetical protein